MHKCMDLSPAPDRSIITLVMVHRHFIWIWGTDAIHLYIYIIKPGLRGGVCNPSFWDGGIWGCLEDSGLVAQTFSQPPASALALVSIWHHKGVNCGLPCCANCEKAILSKTSADQIPTYLLSSGQFPKGSCRVRKELAYGFRKPSYPTSWSLKL